MSISKREERTKTYFKPQIPEKFGSEPKVAHQTNETEHLPSKPSFQDPNRPDLLETHGAYRMN